MKILTIGDIIGDVGIKKFQSEFKKMKDEIDFCIVNAENSADGFGLMLQEYNSLINSGLDVITMFNNICRKKDIFKYIDNDNIIRAANLPKNVPGKGYTVIEKKGKKICVISLLGRTYMSVLSNSPFECIDDILNQVKADIYIIDFHAEATAEKVAMGRYIDGRATILYGTHTHVQTADETILENGLGYITDIGMTGPKNSVIGMDVGVSLKRFLTSLPEKYKLAEGEAKLNGCLFEINHDNCRVISIKRVSID